jgi:hypothetical protein
MPELRNPKRSKNKAVPTDENVVPLGTDKPVREQIKRRAYDLYELRGCQDGSDKKDWFEAEQEIHARRK